MPRDAPEGGAGDCCPVCLEPLSSEAEMRMPGCGHRFHVTCCLTFAQYEVKCPVCRHVPEEVPRRAPETRTITLSWEDLRHLDPGVSRLVSEEGHDMARVYARYRGRRQRLLRRRPDLRAMQDAVRALSRRVQAVAREADRSHQRLCRELWRSDPHGLRAETARLRRNELRLSRRLEAALRPLLGPHPSEDEDDGADFWIDEVEELDGVEMIEV